jgi:tetratricopeptide (TPR) repeat protein
MTRGGLLPYVPMFQGMRAEVALREHNWQEARERAQAALESAEKALQQTSKAEVLRVMAKIYLSAEKPDWEQAETYLQQSIQIHEQYNAQSLAAVSKLELARLYARKGDEEQARAILKEAQKTFMNLKMTWHFVQARQIYPED